MSAFVAAVAAALALAAPQHGPPVPVPILMYHVIAPPPASARYPQLYVRPADFRAQVRWLADHGWHAVTLGDVFASWRDRTKLPRRPVVLSFDDGYRSDYTVARPVLAHYGWAGVLNLEVANTRKSWGLTPRHVRALIRAGWEIDAHTLTHPDLTTLDAVRLRDEVAGSRAWIRKEFHVPVEFFCYPSGRYDAAVIAQVRAAGFAGATTTNEGIARAGEAFTLPRVRVNGDESLSTFAADVEAHA